jgi:CTD kinase subunit alpha
MLLAYDPSKRVTAVQALEAPYFVTEEPLEMLPEYVETRFLDYHRLIIWLRRLSSLEGEWHEFESKRERERLKRRRP